MHADTLIHASWIIPIRPAKKVLFEHALAIEQGKILAVLPSRQARAQIQSRQVLELPGQALLPGLINAHTHAAMSLFRGWADDLPLMTWLQQHIWPAEQKWVSPEFVADGTTLAIAEMLQSGTTCFNDMYFFPNVTGRVAEKMGMRAVLGLILIDFPSAWAKDAAAYLQQAQDTHAQFRNATLIHTALAPHAPYSVADEALQHAHALAERLDLPIHMHVHETQTEIEQSLKRYGQRPLARLHALGLLDSRLLAVHMTQLEAAEIEQLAQCGVHVAHCPESNLKLASGFCPTQALVQAGVNLALGTDGAASNNDLDMFGEMKSAALLAKGTTKDPTALPAFQVLEMATINGAKALGLADHIGSLEIGKAADLIAVDLRTWATQPIFDPVSQIVYAACRQQVSHVWIDGRLRLKKGQLCDVDKQKLQTKVESWRKRIGC